MPGFDCVQGQRGDACHENVVEPNQTQSEEPRQKSYAFGRRVVMLRSDKVEQARPHGVANRVL